MLRKVGQFTVNAMAAIFKGELLVRLHAGRYFFQILYVFVLMSVTIWVSLKTDGAMRKVEDNKQTIKDLEIVTTMKRYELERKNDRKAVKATLESMGSEVSEPVQPAYELGE